MCAQSSSCNKLCYKKVIYIYISILLLRRFVLNEIINYTPVARLIGLDLSKTRKNYQKIASCARAKRITRQIEHDTYK